MLAVVRRWPIALVGALATIGIAIAWAHVFPSLGPTGKWTQADLTYQRTHAQQNPGASGSAVSDREPSIHSHLSSLRGGFRTMGDHPQGYGLGNVGQTASRTDTPILAGESNYTELGVELGVLGSVLWTAWGLTLLAGLIRARAAAATAVFAAMLVLAIQTDVIGDPWVAYCVWALGGLMLQPRLTEAADGATLQRERRRPIHALSFLK